MRIAIVDDELSMRQQLTEYVHRYAEDNAARMEITTFPSGDALLSQKDAEYDVILFDIDMPGTNGIDTARKLRETDERTVILFITNIAQYAINGYEVDAVDYIIKPIGYYDFSLKFGKAIRRAKLLKPQSIWLNTTEGRVRLLVEEILYIEANAHYLIYCTADRQYRVRGSLQEHETEMAAYRFSRIQRSFLVNLAKVKKISAQEVTVGDKTFTVGRSYKQNFLSDYMAYLGG